MLQIDEKKLGKLLEQGKYQEAGQVLDQVLLSDLTEAERGAIYANFALLYMRIINRLNQQYNQTLETANNMMVEIDKKLPKATEDLQMKLVKKKIKDL